MLLVRSPPSVTCGHYPRARNDRIDFAAGWSFPGKEQLAMGRVETKRKKTVHFADTKGLNLTSTLFFVKDNHQPPQPENRRKIFANFYQSNVDRNANRTATGQHTKLLNFKSPVPSASQHECLDRNKVCLEKTLCNRCGIYGRVKVRNVGFTKEVCVRYSWDSWKTFEDTKASYILGAGTLEIDTFFFHIRPPVGISENRRVEFAICYKVNEGFHWDNNFGDNYRLVYLSC